MDEPVSLVAGAPGPAGSHHKLIASLSFPCAFVLPRAFAAEVLKGWLRSSFGSVKFKIGDECARLRHTLKYGTQIFHNSAKIIGPISMHSEVRHSKSAGARASKAVLFTWTRTSPTRRTISSRTSPRPGTEVGISVPQGWCRGFQYIRVHPSGMPWLQHAHCIQYTQKHS